MSRPRDRPRWFKDVALCRGLRSSYRANKMINTSDTPVECRGRENDTGLNGIYKTIFKCLCHSSPLPDRSSIAKTKVKVNGTFTDPIWMRELLDYANLQNLALQGGPKVPRWKINYSFPHLFRLILLPDCKATSLEDLWRGDSLWARE